MRGRTAVLWCVVWIAALSVNLACTVRVEQPDQGARSVGSNVGRNRGAVTGRSQALNPVRTTVITLVAVAEWAELLRRLFHAQGSSIGAVPDVRPAAWDKAGREPEHLIRPSAPLCKTFCEPFCET